VQNSGQQSHNDNSPSGFRRFGNGNGPNNGGIVPNSNRSTGHSGSDAVTPAARSTDQGRVAHTNNSPESSKGGESSGWQKFPPAGERQPVGSRSPASTDKGGSPTQTEKGVTQGASARGQEDHGGWQKFPSSSDHGSSAGNPSANRNDHAVQGGSGGNSKPPLELHRPIVTPRETPASGPRNSSPTPRNEPRYNPPAPRSEPHGSPSPSRSEPHQSHDSGGHSGSSSHSDGGSSSHGGGGAHSDSKSSDHRR
ncbi:MAG TPA: hypothetical protein VGQ12_08270, partial [Candidatus Angelobacter sp.]|nr:hypothetical protein [Candidatus Angelobacter sp.]